MITAITGSGTSAVICNCPAQVEGQPNTCQCIEAPQQTFGRQVLFFGISVTIGGAVMAGVRLLRI